MSSFWLNVRFGRWHVQWTIGAFRPRIWRHEYRDPAWPWFALYQLRRPWW